MKFNAIIMMTAALALAACSDDPEEIAPSPTSQAPSATGPAPHTIEYFNQVVGDRVFFDTDRHDLDGIAVSTLQRQAQWMANNPGTTATVEGHADERGTRAYNLALGARRAASARDFLVSQGVSPDRLRTVSYGKERPVALGSDPQSWAQNRRAVTVVVGAPNS